MKSSFSCQFIVDPMSHHKPYYHYNGYELSGGSCMHKKMMSFMDKPCTEKSCARYHLSTDANLYSEIVVSDSWFLCFEKSQSVFYYTKERNYREKIVLHYGVSLRLSFVRQKWGGGCGCARSLTSDFSFLQWELTGLKDQKLKVGQYGAKWLKMAQNGSATGKN